MSLTVYVCLGIVSYRDRHILKAFLTPEKAEAFCKSQKDEESDRAFPKYDDYEFEEIEVE